MEENNNYLLLTHNKSLLLMDSRYEYELKKLSLSFPLLEFQENNLEQVYTLYIETLSKNSE